MKRLFTPKRKSESELTEPVSTLDRIMKDKEGVKKQLEDEEKEFLYKKRNYERKMIEFEKQEVKRREQEIADRTSELENIRRKNQLVQDKVADQISTLHQKLEELRIQHRTNEDNCLAVISSLNDKVSEVERSLTQRLDSYGEEREIDISPSAPEDTREEDDLSLNQQNLSLYPALPTLPRTWHQIYSATQTTASFRSISLSTVALNKSGPEGSLGSSPQISLDSSTSSRSNTPRIDSDSSI